MIILLERVLGVLIGKDQAELIAGDLFEHEKNGFPLVMEILRSLPAIMILTLSYHRRSAMNHQTLFARKDAFALTGFFATLPAFVLVASGIAWFLGLRAPANFIDDHVRFLIHPGLILGGLALAIVLNILPVLRFSGSSKEGTISATLVLRGTIKNLILLGSCIAITMVMFLYAFGENFIIIQR